MNDNWRQDAACAGLGGTTFFPESATDTRAYLRSVREAYCGRCPVITSCAQAALDNGDRSGIWAGIWLGQNKLSRARDQLRNVAAGLPWPEIKSGGGNRPGHRNAS